jgi:hypothetical protein
MVFLHTRSIYLLSAAAIIFIITTIHQIPAAFHWEPSTFPTRQPSKPHKYALATLPAGTTNSSDATMDDHYISTNYFTAARILTYQLLHAPETRSRIGIPFLVLVTSSVPQLQRDRLAKDGATIIPVDSLHTDWVIPQVSRWADVMAKLRLWQLTQYSKILFLDADSIVNALMDDIFDDPAAQVLETGNKTDAVKADEAPFPNNYLFGGIGQLKFQHAFPPSDANGDYDNQDYLNAGFFLISLN